jgi:hypothetical protein
MKEFSTQNPKYMHAFAEALQEVGFLQEVLEQLPWYHQIGFAL